MSVPCLVSGKQWYELVVFSCLFALAVWTAGSLYWGKPVPSVIPGVEYLVRDVLHLSYP